MFPVFVQNQIKEAEEWFKKAKLLDPDDTMVDHHYGKLCLAPIYWSNLQYCGISLVIFVGIDSHGFSEIHWIRNM